MANVGNIKSLQMLFQAESVKNSPKGHTDLTCAVVNCMKTSHI